MKLPGNDQFTRAEAVKKPSGRLYGLPSDATPYSSRWFGSMGRAPNQLTDGPFVGVKPSLIANHSVAEIGLRLVLAEDLFIRLVSFWTDLSPTFLRWLDSRIACGAHATSSWFFSFEVEVEVVVRHR